MRVLVIGGTRFVGLPLVNRLVAAGHEVAVFHRGEMSHDTRQDLVFDTTRIRTELGYRELVDPDRSLRETVLWEHENLPEIAVDYEREDRLLSELAFGATER